MEHIPPSLPWFNLLGFLNELTRASFFGFMGELTRAHEGSLVSANPSHWLRIAIREHCLPGCMVWKHKWHPYWALLQLSKGMLAFSLVSDFCTKIYKA